MSARVEPIDGERWCFTVMSSEPRHAPYRVDLEFYGGNGSCNCADFRTRHEPDLARGVATGFSRCKHIRIARALVLNTLISASQKNPVFGMTLPAVVRKWWESVMAKTEDKEK